MGTTLELLKLVLPEILVTHFEITSYQKQDTVLHLYFEELNTPPQEHNDKQLISKGFYKEITIQDFPLRGKQVYLQIKRRRWRDKQTGGLIQRDWYLVAQGTRMTIEFVLF